MQEEMGRVVAKLLWETGAVRISGTQPFRLASGNRSPIYIDCRLPISHPKARGLITAFAHWLWENEGLHADCVAGGETAGIPYAAWLADRLGSPLIYVRKKPKEYGARMQVEGDLEPGSMVLLYEDLVTDGKSKLNFVEGIRHAKAQVAHCLVIFDRQQGGAQLLAEQGVSLHSMTNLETSLTCGHESGYLDDLEFDSVKEYIRDPHMWHSERGLEFHG